MLNKQTQQELANLLMKISEDETKVEVYREIVCSNEDFDFWSCFDALDYTGSGKLIPSCFKYLLDQNDYQATEEELYLLIRQYDPQLKGYLTFEDFKELVLPAQSKNYLTQETYLELPYSVECALCKLIYSELQIQRETELVKHSLFQNKQFSTAKAFKSIDKRQLGYIDQCDILEFLEESGSLASLEEVESLFKRAGFSKDQKLDFCRFLDIVLPVETVTTKERTISSINPLDTFDSPIKSNLDDNSFAGRPRVLSFSDLTFPDK